MGTYTGKSGDDTIRGDLVSPDVESIPTGKRPSEESDTLDGREGNDTLDGEGGNDTLHGGTGNDKLHGGTGDDELHGDDGEDELRGEDGTDKLYGGTGNDYLEGNNGDDKLHGDDGNDRLLGGDGNDVLNGGGGQDRLYAGTGNDIFDFDTVSDSSFGENRDSILSDPYVGAIEGFQIGVDKIDVSDIDANVDLAGHQAFAFMGTGSPTGPGQLTLIDSPNGQTIIQLNTGNDLKPESEIAIDDGSGVFASAYTAPNFIFSKEQPPDTSASKPPEIGQVQTFREGDLVFFRLSYTDPNNDAEGFGFRGINGSGWAEETHPFSSPSYGRGSPGTVEYPFNHACATGSPYESDVEAWIYDSTGLSSAPVPIHLACSAQSEIDLIGGTT